MKKYILAIIVFIFPAIIAISGWGDIDKMIAIYFRNMITFAIIAIMCEYVFYNDKW